MFQFCGDLDCPDWVLAEISTLAKMYEKILKLTADSGNVKATVAVLSFILSSAAKHSVDGESLASELQQLGLPQEHAAGLCRCYEEKQSPLQKHLWVCSLRSKYEASQGPENSLITMGRALSHSRGDPTMTQTPHTIGPTSSIGDHISTQDVDGTSIQTMSEASPSLSSESSASVQVHAGLHAWLPRKSSWPQGVSLGAGLGRVQKQTLHPRSSYLLCTMAAKMHQHGQECLLVPIIPVFWEAEVESS
uniref:COMM domain-containing protein n=1 Tax=Piliocolobus tephrosceles TaxID=591936 RepID=A0A8C9I7S6_9PRIM